MGFFLQQQGAFQPFLFDDPTDDTVTGQAIGTGDGSARCNFQLRAQPMGGFAEPITAPNAVDRASISTASGRARRVTRSTARPGLVTFATPPPAGQLVTADFTYYFRVRFADDTRRVRELPVPAWALKQIKLQSVLP